MKEIGDLTDKQHDFLEWVVAFVKVNDRFPTYTEMQDGMDYNSPNSVTQKLKALRRKGYLTKEGKGEWRLHRRAVAPRQCPKCGYQLDSESKVYDSNGAL